MTDAEKFIRENCIHWIGESEVIYLKPSTVAKMAQDYHESQVKKLNKSDDSGSLPLAEGLLRSINACDPLKADVMINDLRSQCEHLIENMKRQ